MSEVQMLPIDKIGYDPQFYPRVNGKEDWLTVHRYKEVLKSHPDKADHRKPGSFPPIIVVKVTGYEWLYLILDGLHRLSAFRSAGYDKIPCIVERLPQSKWLERSVELNIDSKRPLDTGDKRWVATKLTAEGWKPEKIASLLCMERGSFDKMVATNIHKLSQTSVKGMKDSRANRLIGKQRYGFLKAAFTPISGTSNADKALRSQAAVSSRDAYQIVESFIALLEAKAIDVGDEALMGRLRTAGELIDDFLGGSGVLAAAG